MVTFLIIALTLGVVVALIGLLVLASLVSEGMDAERARIEAVTRAAERRVHDVARDGFEAMLTEARRHGHGRVD